LRKREDAKCGKRGQDDLRQQKESLQNKKRRRRRAQVQVTDPDKKRARENKCDQAESKIPTRALKNLDRAQHDE